MKSLKHDNMQVFFPVSGKNWIKEQIFRCMECFAAHCKKGLAWKKNWGQQSPGGGGRKCQDGMGYFIDPPLCALVWLLNVHI